MTNALINLKQAYYMCSFVSYWSIGTIMHSYIVGMDLNELIMFNGGREGPLALDGSFKN